MGKGYGSNMCAVLEMGLEEGELVINGDVTVCEVSRIPVEKEYVAYQFIPGSNDQHVCAIKSQKLPDGRYTSFFQIFWLKDDCSQAKVIMNDQEIPWKENFHGLTFLPKYDTAQDESSSW